MAYGESSHLYSLAPSEVLYMEIPKGPLACRNCVMWVLDANRCTVHGKAQKVTGDMICGLYVNGKPMPEAHAMFMASLGPEVTGLGKGETNCGNCGYGSGRARCAHPDLTAFSINNDNGCCNAWRTPDEATDPKTDLPHSKGEVGYARTKRAQVAGGT